MSIASWITDNIFDSKNKERAKGYNVDSDAYQYGQDPLGAENAAEGYAKTANDAASRAGVVANFGQANADRARGLQARTEQSNLARVMANRATGGAPSIAQQQADRQMGQIASQQASMAGSARGAGGLAAAQRNAAFNGANTGADISGQAQIAAGQERRDDTNAAAGMYTNIRGGDLSSQAQAAGQATTQAGLADNQRARNDAQRVAYDQMTNQVRTTQLTAHQNEQAQRSANALGAQGINAGVGGQNAAMNRASADAALGAGQSVAGAVAGGLIPGKATGGPVAGGAPYIVGKKGPELIVPPKDGFVLTHDQTKQALSTPGLANVVKSTWGTGPDKEAQPEGTYAWQAEQAVEDRNAGDRDRDARQPGSTMAVAGFSPGLDQKKDEPLRRQDQNMSSGARAKEAQGIDLSDREAYEAQGANYRLGNSKKLDRAAGSPKSSLASVLGDMGKKEQEKAASIDTSYHGGGSHYTPPQLIPLRAGGGPVSGGMPFIGGEQGPEMLVPLSGPGAGRSPGAGVGGGIELGPGGGISHNDLLAAGTGLAQPQAVKGMVGGGGITGGGSMGGHAIPGMAGAREDGGPVDADKTYLTGEKGPEMVVPAPAPTAQERVTAQTSRDADNISKLAQVLGGIAPGLSPIVGSQALGIGASAAVMGAEDAAARKARQEQADMDRERNELNARDRQQAVTPQPAPAALNKTDEETQRRITGRTGEETPWRKQRSLWDILKGTK